MDTTPSSLSTNPLGLAWVALLGFVRPLSSPQIVPNPDPPSQLLEIVKSIVSQPGVRIIAPGARHVDIMETLFRESGGGNRLVPDIHLAALAIEHDATLASNDTDFGRFSALKWVNPL